MGGREGGGRHNKWVWDRASFSGSSVLPFSGSELLGLVGKMRATACGRKDLA